MAIDKSVLASPMGQALSLEDAEVRDQEDAIMNEDQLDIILSGEEDMLDEDGGATINLSPETMPTAAEGFYANLVGTLDPADLAEVRSYVLDSVEADKNSRKDWEDTYTKGLDLLGLKNEKRTEPFEGATGVFHPLLSEAIGQFQAGAYKELIPSNGPVNTKVLGKVTPDLERAAMRVKEYMNYKIMFEMEEFESEYDQMLYYVGLAGSTFKKVYRDEDLGRTVSNFIQVENLLVPYTASSLRTADRITQILPMSRNKLKNLQSAGFYSGTELPSTTITVSEIKQKYDELEGKSPSYTTTKEDGEYTLYECHCYFTFDSLGDGERLPYIVTVLKDTQEVIGVRRNWREEDPRQRRRDFFVHYKFMPGLGFFGFGLIHLLGNLTQSATSTLRQLIDSGTLANLPGGFKARGLRIANDQDSINPGEWRDVDVVGNSIRESLMPLPYKEPSPTLFQLLGFVVQAAEKFVGTQELGIADGNKETPVGTTVALLERGTKIMSAVHKRLHGALKIELRLLAENFAQDVQAYPYEVEGAAPEVFAEDFSPRVDIVPISDPNIFSMAQRVVLAQEQLKLAQTSPEMHDLYEAYRRVYSALGVQDIDSLLKPPQQPQPENPAIENGRMPLVAGGGGAPPLQVFPDQDHDAHIAAHLAFGKSKIVQTSTPIYAVLVAHVFEHMAAKAEIVARQELEMPPRAPVTPDQPVDPTSADPMLQNRVAQLIAQYTLAFMKVEEAFFGDSENSDDPIVKLKGRELDIREEENQRRAREEREKQAQQARESAAKLRQQQRMSDDRIKSQENLAAMRASIDLTKMFAAPQKPNGGPPRN